MAKKKKKFNIGDEVQWTDPDEGQSSGIYKVVARHSDEEEDDEDTIYDIDNGFSEAEVYRSELT